MTLVLNCSRKEGSTTEEDLAESTETMVKNHGLATRVVVRNTDCEPSM